MLQELPSGESPEDSQQFHADEATRLMGHHHGVRQEKNLIALIHAYPVELRLVGLPHMRREIAIHTIAHTLVQQQI